MADEINPNASDQAFPAADVENDLNPPPANNSLEVDPVSSEVNAMKGIEREKDEAAVQPRKKTEKKDALQTLKTAVIVSAVVVAVAGAIFAITKKLKEK